MSEGAALEMSRFQSTLHQDDEEDLIDYCDSDAEAEKSNIQETTVTVAIEEIDIFADDVTQVDSSEQSDQPDHIYSNVEEPTGNSAGEQAIKSAEKSANILGAELAASPVGTSASTTIKTAEAATLIKDLNELLTNPDVRASLGLVEAGNALDLSFWADGLDFNLSLKLVGAAQIKACNYGAKCRNKDCTYDHGGADRTAIIAGKKPRKLCSVINTPASCAMGDACWFSHEALGVACADGDLRATCAKGMYCVYKHDDDEVVTSVKQTEQQQEQVVHGEEIKEPEASARNAPPIDSTAVTKTESAPLAPAPSATESPKEQVRRVKRGRELKDGAVGRPGKSQRVGCQSRQEPSAGRGRQRSSAPERADSENADQGSRGSGSRGRGRSGGRGGTGGGRGGRSGSYRPFEGGRKQVKKEPLEKRITRG